MKVIANERNAARLADLEHIEIVHSPEQLDKLPQGATIYQHGPYPGDHTQQMEMVKKVLRKGITVQTINDKGEIV